MSPTPATRRGVKTVAVTAGYIHDAPRREFYAKMDAANVDLKAFTDEFYFKLSGARLRPVLDTLVYLKHQTACGSRSLRCSFPARMIRRREITAMSEWIMRELGPDVPLHFTAFHPDHKMTRYTGHSGSHADRSRRIALDAGLHYVYTGNIHDSEGGTTYCPSCHAALIVRDWYGFHSAT